MLAHLLNGRTARGQGKHRGLRTLGELFSFSLAELGLLLLGHSWPRYSIRVDSK